MAKPFKIVVPTDFSDASKAALRWTDKVAAGQAAEVHCITVVHQPMVYMPMMAGAATQTVPTNDQLTRLATDSLDEFIANNMSDLKQRPVTKVLEGRPANEIVDYAAAIDADIIIIATHGHSGLTHALLGSTAADVVRTAPCPVLTVRK